jgi:hypothetical protein
MGKYVFPGADASCPLGWVIEQLEGGGFEIRSEETIGIHYSATIRCWYQNWMRPAVKQEIEAKYGVRMYRLWAWFLAWSVISPEVSDITTTAPGSDGCLGEWSADMVFACAPFPARIRFVLPDRRAQEHASLQPQAVHRRARELPDLSGPPDASSVSENTRYSRTTRRTRYERHGISYSQSTFLRTITHPHVQIFSLRSFVPRLSSPTARTTMVQRAKRYSLLALTHAQSPYTCSSVWLRHMQSWL